MRSPAARRFRLLLPVALYAIFLWRMPYSMKHLALRILDWTVPALGLGVWALARWRRREPWPSTPLDWPLLAWCAVLTWSALFSVNSRVSLHGVWEAWIGALILWLLVDLVRRGWGQPLWQATYLVAGVVCLLGVMELLAWYLGWPLLPQFQQGWFSIGGLAHPVPPTIHRMGLALVNTTALSAYIALLIPPALCIAVSARNRDVRWGMALWLAAAGGTVVASSSRGGFLALGVSLPVVVAGSLLSPGVRRRWSGSASRRVRVMLTGAAIVTLVAAAVIAYVLIVRLDPAAHRSGDAVRLDLWRSATAMLRDHPLTGVGTAAYGTALRLYRDPLLARDHIVTAHNLYLNTGAEAGFPGLIASAWLLATLAWSWWKRWRATPAGTRSWWRLLGVGASLAGLAAQSVVDTFTEPAIVLVATFFIARIIAVPPAKQSEPAGERPAAPSADTRQSPKRNGVGSRPWPWAATVAFLALGAAGLAWESVGGAYFAQSLALTARGKIDEAAAAAEQAQKKDPGPALYACHAGYLYGTLASEGKSEALPAALKRTRECLATVSAPGWVDQLNLAALLWASGQKAEARATVAETTTRTPLEWMPWLSQGYWAEVQGDRDEAVRSYGWVLALDPDLAGSPFWRQAARAHLWNEIVTGGAQTAQQIGKDPTYWRWQVALAANQAEATTQEIEAWLSLHPHDAEAKAWLGEALLEQGQPEEALSWLDQALAAAPSRSRSYVARGEAALTRQNYAEAERDLRTALFLEPSSRAHLALARLALATGDEQPALKEYSQALRGLPLVHSFDLVLYDWMGWPAPLPQALRIGYRHDEPTALEWGGLLERQGDTTTAQKVYLAALELDPFLDQVRQRLQPGNGEP
jgi:tetratricopeptide (TPR) repeat protein/O-antigen ligase